MTCALCECAFAVNAPDPRIPLLRIPCCWTCRDRLARALGWVKNRRTSFWTKAFVLPVEVIR